MELNLKHVAVDELVGKSVAVLREIGADADALKRAVQAELKRQADEALAALEESGGDSIAPTPRKRGRKPNAEKAAELEANGNADAAEVDLDDEFSSVGNA